MTSTNDRIDDLALALADTYAMNCSHEQLITDMRAFPCAYDFIDLLIHDSRDELDDDDFALINDHHDRLMLMIATKLLDFLASA